MPQSRHVQRWCYRSVIAMLVAIGLLLPVTKIVAAQPISASENKSLNEFTKRAKRYISQEHALPAAKLKPKSDADQLDRERVALREAVHQSRPTAKQGDLFTAPVANVFRKLMTQTLAGPDGAKIKASLMHAEPSASTDLVVNREYPNRNGQPIQSVPPTLLQALPSLPRGLEYRIAGKTLAVRDTNANMVVDFLPDALP